MPSTSFPLPGAQPRPIAKEIYAPDSPLTSEVAMRLANNDSSLFRLITGMQPSANGVVSAPEPGHKHQGGIDGVPILRTIAGTPQSVNYLWSITCASGASSPFNSDATYFDVDTYDIMFWVPHGVSKVNFYINATITYADAGGTGYLRCRVGSTDYNTPLTAGGVTWTKLWSGETNGPQTHTSDIKVIPNSMNTAQLYFYNDFGAASTLNVYGWFFKEATDIT